MDDIMKVFKQNLETAVLGAVKKKQCQVTSESLVNHQESNDGRKSDGRAKTAKRPMSVSKQNGAKRTCSKLEEKQHSSSETKNTKDHRKTSVEEKHPCNKDKMPDTKKNPKKGNQRAERKHRGAKKRKKPMKKNSSDSESDLETTGAELPPNTSKPLLYVCTGCDNVETICYDHIIQHCQDHILKEQGYYNERYYTPLDYYIIDYGKNSDRNSLTVVNCDYSLLKSNKWPAIFETLTQPESEKINCNSIYYFSRIIRLSSRHKQSSAPFMLFLCMKCFKYVDPYSIVSHVQENSCNPQLTGFRCHKCRKEFLTENAMYLHYNTHNEFVGSSHYREVLFNDSPHFYADAMLINAAGLDAKYALEEDDETMRDKRKTHSIYKILEALVAEREIEVKQTHQTANDARTMVIHGTQSEVGNEAIECHDTSNHNNVSKEEKHFNIYKCRCELCFHTLEALFRHLESCRPESELQTKTCICGLTFDEPQYDVHCNTHCQGFTKFSIKKVTMCDENVIDVKNMQHKFKRIL